MLNCSGFGVSYQVSVIRYPTNDGHVHAMCFSLSSADMKSKTIMKL